MKYAIWNLVVDAPNYLTGPESRIAELGGSAEAAWSNGEPEDDADILGYVYGDFDANEMSHWNYRELTQEEALDFCKTINAQAYLLEDGKIAAPIQE